MFLPLFFFIVFFQSIAFPFVFVSLFFTKSNSLFFCFTSSLFEGITFFLVPLWGKVGKLKRRETNSPLGTKKAKRYCQRQYKGRNYFSSPKGIKNVVFLFCRPRRGRQKVGEPKTKGKLSPSGTFSSRLPPAKRRGTKGNKTKLLLRSFVRLFLLIPLFLPKEEIRNWKKTLFLVPVPEGEFFFYFFFWKKKNGGKRTKNTPLWLFLNNKKG